ncbi:unnamed protein product [Spirodela intermedia]|uniref:Uncharacterized protein n=1 Tax=Spirodela intermedia TaxID=51605 RepID=A0A7I8KB44_SPIIN|nr:unnamed protein product [Spirodela intermedia]
MMLLGTHHQRSWLIR